MGGGKRKKTYQLKKIKPTWGDREERAETSIRSKSKRRNTGERRERERESLLGTVAMARGSFLAFQLWIFACLLLVLRASSFYLPGVAPQDFQKVCPRVSSANRNILSSCSPASLDTPCLIVFLRCTC